MLCAHPINPKGKDGIVPCGQCLPCRINKRREWTFRLCMEALTHEKTCWLTVTYNQEFVPRTEDGRLTLDFEQHRLFMMRLRVKFYPLKFRFYTVGEYGDETYRPHFHICLFGLDGRNDLDTRRKIVEAWREPGTGKPMGRIHFYPLEKNNIQYTCGYTVKKMTARNDPLLEGLVPEDSRMSQGIGRDAVSYLADAIRPHVDDMHDVPSVFLFNGKKWPVPRYMKEKLRHALGIHEQGTANARTDYAISMRTLSETAYFSSDSVKKSAPSIGALLTYGNHLTNGQKIERIELRQKRKRKKGVL